MVIDGSKTSRKVGLIARGLEGEAAVKVIHLVRDPRGFVASTRSRTPDVMLEAASRVWADSHRRIEALGNNVPYLLVRYEELTRVPERQAASILRFLGVAPEPISVPPRYPVKHHLMGNRMLFSFTGSVTTDERWRQTLSAEDQRQVLRCSGELAEKYGYR